MLARALMVALCCYIGPIAAIETRTALPGQARPIASVHDLGWLAGRWSGEGITGPAHEVYSAPAGGAIVGHFRQQRGDGIWFYELMVVRPDAESITYCLRHFNPDLTAWEEKNDVRCFPLIDREADTWYFDGLTIRREDQDNMVAAVRIASGSEVRDAVFRYRRESHR